jgi:hypothetical protein
VVRRDTLEAALMGGRLSFWSGVGHCAVELLEQVELLEEKIISYSQAV